MRNFFHSLLSPLWKIVVGGPPFFYGWFALYRDEFAEPQLAAKLRLGGMLSVIPWYLWVIGGLSIWLIWTAWDAAHLPASVERRRGRTGKGLLERMLASLHWVIARIARDDLPHLIHGEGSNHIARYEDQSIVVAIVPIENRVGRISENSVAFSVSASLDFFDRHGGRILGVDNACLMESTTGSFFSAGWEARPAGSVDMYPGAQWIIPIVYKWQGDSRIFAYDERNPIGTLLLGQLPIEVRIDLRMQNLPSGRPMKFVIWPQPRGSPDGFWIRMP